MLRAYESEGTQFQSLSLVTLTELSSSGTIYPPHEQQNPSDTHAAAQQAVNSHDTTIKPSNPHDAALKPSNPHNTTLKPSKHT
ncbi:hypothetical protein TNCV_781041 [Trichonephila clavipes]|nr:hypothetical protein TNCV_781041 [Trichonephila clavipes]